MNNIILGGVPRAGKSSLAQRLCEQTAYSHIPFDSLISAFGAIFPEHGISHYLPHQQVCQAVKPFFFEWLQHREYEQIPIIIDAYHIHPQDLYKNPLCSRYTVVFVGYPSAVCEHKCAAIRQYARPGDWTELVSAAELQPLVNRYIAESRILQEACAHAAYPFFDTSKHFHSVLEHAVHTLLSNTPSRYSMEESPRKGTDAHHTAC